MRTIRRLVVAVAILAMVGTSGCSKSREPDERLTELAQRSVEAQARQNEKMAEQSQQTAEAAKHLVAEDAKARREMADAQATLRHELQRERQGIERQRTDLERERREISAQRGRDPIIAETIGVVGGVIACLLPLLLAAYVLYSANRGKADSEMLNELLVTGIIDDELKLMTGSRDSTARLHQPANPRALDDTSGEDVES